MKKKITTITGFLLCLVMSFSAFTSAGCNKVKASLSGTALAEALLAKERINHEHLSSSFDFLDNRLTNNVAPQSSASAFASPFSAVTTYASSNGQVVSGSESAKNRVVSWTEFEKFATELKYFKSHFTAGQSCTEKVDENITFLEGETDVKDKWVKGVSWMDYLMQVEENSEIIYERDDVSNNYSIGIRTVNDEVNTTYEYYENQGDLYIRTLATPNRRYEYTTVSGGNDVLAFVADNDNGYWRLVSLDSRDGKELDVSVLIMTDNLAYDFRCSVSESSAYSYSATILSPDLQYEIAYLNGSEITVYPGSFTGIKELRVSEEEQSALGQYGESIVHSRDYGYYYTDAIPHIVTNNGTIQAATPCAGPSGVGSSTIPTELDQNVSYVDGNVRSLWETNYPELVFNVQGDSYKERFENLHSALAKYGVYPIYDAQKVGLMAEDVDKLSDSFYNHYFWNGFKIENAEGIENAYDAELAKAKKYETLYTNAQSLPTATKGDLIEAQQNAGFSAISFGADATVSVQNGKVTLSGVSATVDANAVLEDGTKYELKIALKKNTDQLEELIVLDNLLTDSQTTYESGDLTLVLSGEFNLPVDVSVGEYDLVAYAASAQDGIRVSKFKRVVCVGQVNDKVTLQGVEISTTLTAENYVRSTYSNLFDLNVEISSQKEYYTKAEILEIIENVIMDKGYFMTGASLEYYDSATGTSSPVTEDSVTVGEYRLKYLGKADGGEIEAYVYCSIT